MIKIISKQVFALRNNPLINEEYFKRIQEGLGQNPTSPYRKRHDSGKLREVIPDLSPAGPQEIPREQGDKSSLTNVSSGYNRGPDPNSQADDETGPGNTPSSDKEQNYKDPGTVEMAFRSENDHSSKYSLLNNESNKRDQKTTTNLHRIYNKPKIKPRVSVDRQWSRQLS